jgi:hypothetical protein
LATVNNANTCNIIFIIYLTFYTKFINGLIGRKKGMDGGRSKNENRNVRIEKEGEKKK